MKRLLISLILLISVSTYAQMKFTPYGHAQYRLRLSYSILTPDQGDNLTALAYHNQIAYYAGLRALISESMSFQFQIGNDWVATEDVEWGANEAWEKRDGLYPYFHLAYFNWNPGLFYLMGGIVPISSHGALDLIERSLNADSYSAAAFVGWPVGTNGSSMGLKVGAPILKNDFSMGVEVFSTTTSNRIQQLAEDASENLNAVMFVINVPMSIAKLSFTPQFSTIINRLYNPNTGESDHEYATGLSANYTFSKIFSMSAKFGYAQIANENSGLARESENEFDIADTGGSVAGVIDTTTVDDQNHIGMIAGIGGSIILGPGSIIFEGTYSSNENSEVDESSTHFFFGDLKYGWNLNEHLTLMPRIRSFTTVYPEAAQNESKTEILTEILFIARF